MKHVSGRRFCEALEAKGWIWDRTNGAQRIDEDPTTGRSVSVPVHGNKDLRNGTQRKLMADAGLTDDDL